MKYQRAVICWSLGAGFLFLAAWIPGSWFADLPAGELNYGDRLLNLEMIPEFRG